MDYEDRVREIFRDFEERRNRAKKMRTMVAVSIIGAIFLVSAVLFAALAK